MCSEFSPSNRLSRVRRSTIAAWFAGFGLGLLVSAAAWGDEGDAAYVILEGAVDVLIPTDTGEISVAVLGAKEIFGEMAVLLDQPRTTAIAANTDLKVLRLDRQAFFSMLSEFPDVAIELIKIIGGRLEATTRDLAAASRG